MFDNFPEPWKGTNLYVKTVIKDIETGKDLVYGTGIFVHDSLSFSNNLLSYKLEVVPTTKLKYRRTIVFPLKYIKFFEIGEFFDYKDQTTPRSYQVTFWVDLCSTNKMIKEGIEQIP